MSVIVQMSYSVGGGPWERTPVHLRAAFERAGDNVAKPMRFIAPELTKLLERTLKKRFAAQGAGGPVSGRWAELTPKYKKWKQAHYPGRKILVLTGAMRDALTNSASPGAFRDSTPDVFGFGTRRIEYASFHQGGTSKMSPRPPFDFGGAEFDTGFRKAAQLGIVKALRDAKMRVTE